MSSYGVRPSFTTFGRLHVIPSLPFPNSRLIVCLKITHPRILGKHVFSPKVPRRLARHVLQGRHILAFGTVPANFKTDPNHKIIATPELECCQLLTVRSSPALVLYCPTDFA